MSRSPETAATKPGAKKETGLPGERIFGWTSSPRAGQFVFFGLAALAIVLFLLDFVIHRHEYFSFPEMIGFHAMYGFGAFALVVLSGWPLRRLLGRPEDYYGEDHEEELSND